MNIRQTIYLSILLIIISTGSVLAVDDTTTGNVAATGNMAVIGNVAVNGNIAVNNGNMAVTGNVAVTTTGNMETTTGNVVTTTEIPVTGTAVPTQKSPGFTSILVLATMVVLYMIKRKK